MRERFAQLFRTFLHWPQQAGRWKASRFFLAAFLIQGCAIVPSLWKVQPESPPGDEQSATVGMPRPTETVKKPVPPAVAKVNKGEASWYGPGLHGKKTASGEIFDQTELTAAHRTFPLGSRARVTNLHNGKSVVVEINDRGPFADNRVIDLSRAAAKALGIIDSGTAQVKVELLSEAQKLEGAEQSKK